MGLRLRAPRSMRVLSVVLMVWERAEKKAGLKDLFLFARTTLGGKAEIPI